MDTPVFTPVAPFGATIPQEKPTRPPTPEEVAQAEAQADIEVARARAIAKAKKLPAGQSLYNPVNKEPEDPELPSRFALMSGTASSEHAVREIQKRGFEAHDLTGKYDLIIRSKKDGLWHRLDPQGGGIGERLKDVADVAGGASNVVAQTLGHIGGALGGTAVGGPAGGVAGGMAGGAAAAGGEEAIRVGVLGRLAGFDPTLGETASAAGREAAYGAAGEVLGPAAGAVLRPAGKGAAAALKAPLKAENWITGAADVIALKKARANELAARIAAKRGMTETEKASMEQAIKEGGEVAGKAATEAATSVAEEAAPKAMFEQGPRLIPGETPKIKIAAETLHPAYGVKAKYKVDLPEVEQIGRKHFGEQFAPPLGSQAMDYIQNYLNRWVVGKTQREVDTALRGWETDIAKFILGSSKFKGLSDAAKRSVAKVGAGIARDADRVAFENILKSKLGEASLDVMEKRLATMKNVGGAVDEIFAGQSGQDLRRLGAIGLKSTIGSVTRGSYLAGVALEKLMGKTPAQLSIAAQTAPPAIRGIIAKILAQSPDNDRFYALMISAMKIPAMRDWVEKWLAEGGNGVQKLRNQPGSAQK